MKELNEQRQLIRVKVDGSRVSFGFKTGQMCAQVLVIIIRYVASGQTENWCQVDNFLTIRCETKEYLHLIKVHVNYF